MAKKIIEVTMKISFPINELGPAHSFKKECTDFLNDRLTKGLDNFMLCHGVGFEIRGEHDSYPASTCDWCEKDFERNEPPV